MATPDTSSSTDAFFGGLRNAMSPQPDAGVHTVYAIVALATIALAWWFIARQRQRGTEKRKLAILARQRDLTPAETQLIATMSRGVHLAPVAVGTRIDLFERASAAHLALSPPQLDFDNESDFATLYRLRRKLGFEKLPPHFPLLTSRKLSTQFAIEVLQRPARIAGVTEAFVLVHVRTTTPVSRGDTLSVSVVHTAEARYQLQCLVLHVEPTSEAELEIYLAHDEAPERVQHRKYARVPLESVVPVTIPPNALFGVDEPRHELAQCVNVSGGGMLIDSPNELPKGMTILVSFDIRGTTYGEFEAEVLASRKARGAYATHLEFNRLADRVRNNLIAAITTLSSQKRE